MMKGIARQIGSISKKVIIPMLGFGVWASGGDMDQYTKDQLEVHHIKQHSNNAKKHNDKEEKKLQGKKKNSI